MRGDIGFLVIVSSLPPSLHTTFQPTLIFQRFHIFSTYNCKFFPLSHQFVKLSSNEMVRKPVIRKGFAGVSDSDFIRRKSSRSRVSELQSRRFYLQQCCPVSSASPKTLT